MAKSVAELLAEGLVDLRAKEASHVAEPDFESELAKSGLNGLESWHAQRFHYGYKVGERPKDETINADLVMKFLTSRKRRLRAL